MYKSTAMLLDELSSYRDPFGKIKRLLSEGKLHQLTKAIYQTDSGLPGYLFAPAIYGPSYLSFDYALSRHGLIPEAVHEYTNATFGKGRKKTYHNDFGDYSYRDIPKAAYPYGQTMQTESGYTYFLATPEKALCDKLYTLPPVKNQAELRKLLFDDLRIDDTGFSKLDPVMIKELSPLYKSNNIRLLSKIMKKKEDGAPLLTNVTSSRAGKT